MSTRTGMYTLRELTGTIMIRSVRHRTTEQTYISCEPCIVVHTLHDKGRRDVMRSLVCRGVSVYTYIHTIHAYKRMEQM